MNGGLVVRGMRVSYGRTRVVHDLDLDVPDGTCVAIIGANGAGKTSFLRGVSGLEHVGSSTSVVLNGTELVNRTEDERARLGLGHVLENRHLFSRMTVAQNLELAGQLAGDPVQQLERVLEMIPEIADLMDRKAASLSGGQQQFVAIGRAMMTDPKALMLDEPTNGLAPQLIDRVIELLIKLRNSGVATLLVEQRLEVAVAVASQVYVLSHGRIVHTADAADPGLADAAHAAYLT
ncbi:MAG TPA: ABC transporter ATP-binding protein [Jatrophihabitans sp.]|jgi:ABC-type branched-subunit amino acid transport system ATPase component